MADIIIYNTKDGKTAIKLYADNGTVWLTQAQIAELFTKNISTISRHIANIFDENEIEEKSNLRFMQIANSDKPVALYSLDVILAVGFRVRSPRGTQFRQWANNTLKEYLQKGFILDKDRLKKPDGRPDYFDELLEQIRDIRASEKRFYQKLRASEKQLSKNIYERGVDDAGFGRIRSAGDCALFGRSTQSMKERYGVTKGRPLADFLPNLTIAAKNLATEMTNYNTKAKDLYGEPSITHEHVQNNSTIRNMLGERGIKPENLPPAEDIKKVERRVKSNEKKLAKGSCFKDK